MERSCWMNRLFSASEASPSELPLQMTREIALVGAFVVLMTVFSWVKVPVGPVPVTLQTLGAFLAVGILGTRRGTAAIAAWVALGMMGLPVFANFAGGPVYLLGPTGGYIIGLIASAAITGKMMDVLGRSVWAMALSMAAGLVACYAFGTAWFMGVYGAAAGMGIESALAMCVAPFVVADIAKIAVAVAACRLISFARSSRIR